ncbi:Flagellar hook-length control protein fliK [Rhodovastum atsumiense]|uniref:Uncharacterized protein n=1 Tax=Rhodovastum atsumiense TaxID=504468 RepID=A0A5M6IXE3_9PROT|nr:hypothetical protein [Rhodovastum atsumiense]KAA5612045.1 hypothetical protein F1189_11340 [Rhodovastum atsumiense]CAH2604089.1 Flagellar hook-length control protein fliK [Rhodovastum atsumiense]
MKSFSRLALATVLMGAFTLPALAETTAPQATPAPHPHATHAATGHETIKPAPVKAAEKPAATSDKTSGHAQTAPEAKPGATAGTTTPAPQPAPTKTN